MLLPVDNAIRRRIDMMKKLTILAMVLVMVALASPAMADNDRHNNRFDDDRHNNRFDDDDRFHGSCWEWSSVFEEWQWDCD